MTEQFITTDHFNSALRHWAEVFMRHSMHEYLRFSRQSGLSMAQINTLFRLYHTGECGVSDVGDHLGVTNAAASQMVDRLVQQGLLERDEHPEDRRAKKLTLTPQGQQLVEASIEVRQRWMEQLTTAFNPSEQGSIADALIKLTVAAERLEDDEFVPGPAGKLPR
jgi:DNA-binding MarR family transcriptional regulator